MEEVWKQEEDEKKSREKRRVMGKVEENICGLYIREKMENRTRDESNGGLESKRRRRRRTGGGQEVCSKCMKR